MLRLGFFILLLCIQQMILAQDSTLEIYINTNNCLQHSRHLSTLDEIPNTIKINVHLQQSEKKATDLILSALGLRNRTRVNCVYDSPKDWFSGLYPPSFSAYHYIENKDTIAFEMLDFLVELPSYISTIHRQDMLLNTCLLRDTLPFTKRTRLCVTAEQLWFTDLLLGKLAVLKKKNLDFADQSSLKMLDVDSIWNYSWQMSNNSRQLPIELQGVKCPLATILGASVYNYDEGLLLALRPELDQSSNENNWVALLKINDDLESVVLHFIDLDEWTRSGYDHMMDVGSFTTCSDTLLSLVFKISTEDTIDAFIGKMPYDTVSRSYHEVVFHDINYPTSMLQDGFRYALHNGSLTCDKFIGLGFPIVFDYSLNKTLSIAQNLHTNGTFFTLPKRRYYLLAASCEIDQCYILFSLDNITYLASFNSTDINHDWKVEKADLTNSELDLGYTVFIHEGKIWGLDKSWSKLVSVPTH